MLVAMVVSSCPTAQAIDWNYWSERVSDKAKQVSSQIKKPRVQAFLIGAAVVAVGGYIYLRNQAVEIVKSANGLLQGVDDRHNVSTPEADFQHVDVNDLLPDIERLKVSIKDLETKNWIYQFVDPYRTTMAQLQQRKKALEGFMTDESSNSEVSEPSKSEVLDID